MMRRNDPILGDAAILTLALERRKKRGSAKRLKMDEAVISHLNLGIKAMESVMTAPMGENAIEAALRLLRGSNLTQRDIVEGTGRIELPEEEFAHRKRYNKASFVWKSGEKKAYDEEQRQLAQQEAYVPYEEPEEEQY